jgi:hypothetical protein
VASCISSLWITPLVNGRPINFFDSSHGLRQGFPLSPLLYIIMENSLNRKLEYERTIRNLPGLQIVWGSKGINHSQFVDDTLLMGGASTIIASRFKQILDSFLDASRSTMNNIECHILGWKTMLQVMHSISRIL